MRKKSMIKLVVTLVFILGWTVLLYFLDPKELVSYVGIHNGYIMSLFLALFGGITTITFFTLYPGIIAFALGGLNPLLLGLIVGIGLTLGNLIYYYLGYHGRKVLVGKLSKRQKKMLDWVQNKPCWIVQILIFAYVAFTPLPNNFVTISSGLTGLRFRVVVIPLAIGNFVLMASLSYFAILGISVF